MNIEKTLKTQINDKTNKNMLSQKTKDIIAGYLFISPIVIGILLFSLGPILFSFFISFTNFDNFKQFDWVGLENYKKMFSDSRYLHSFWITLKFALIFVVFNLTLSFLLAVMLNAKIKAIGIFRTLLYSPVIIPGVAATFIFIKMFSIENGYVNNLLQALGYNKFPFFTSVDTAMFSIIVFSLWTLGAGMLIWLSGLKNIPNTYYEAADIDGASWFHKFIHITIPLITPIIFYNLIMGIIGGLQCFAQVYLLTGGQGTGPGDSLNFLVYKIYRDGLQPPFEMGYASAQAWSLFGVIFILTLLVFKSSSWVFYGDEGV